MRDRNMEHFKNYIISYFVGT